MTDIQKANPITLSEIIEETDESIRDNWLTVLVNQEPPKQWIQEHPFVKLEIEKDGKKIKVPAPYLPINKIEYLLTKIYGKTWVEVKEVKVIANSVQVTVRLFVKNPITGETEYNDGVGAVAMQTDQGAGATDFDKIKSSAVQMAVPSAKAYAKKDAAAEFGKIFGRDLTRKGSVDYGSLLKERIDIDDVQELFDLKKDSLTSEETNNAERIIKNKEINSYSKLHSFLKEK